MPNNRVHRCGVFSGNSTAGVSGKISQKRGVGGGKRRRKNATHEPHAKSQEEQTKDQQKKHADEEETKKPIGKDAYQTKILLGEGRSGEGAAGKS